VVLLDRVYDDSPFDQVSADNRESMRRLVAHLRGAGHERFALVAGDTRVPTLIERMQGFVDELGPGHEVLTGTDAEEQHARLVRLLADPEVSCLVASSTPLAVLGLRAAREAGRRVPDDLAFATFDGFDHSDLFEPAITTVRQPAAEMGRAAVGLLLERLDDADGSARTLRLRQTLELRSSSETFIRPSGTHSPA
jgi:LacI family transcriptional regulator